MTEDSSCKTVAVGGSGGGSGPKPPKPASATKPLDVVGCFVGCSVLITGATGFLGKVLVEKLLYSVPGIEHVYLLIRPRQGQTAKDRLDKLLKSPLFNRIRLHDETLLKKLQPISADLMQDGLGLFESDAQMLTRVQFVFHCAATVKFDERLKDAVRMNVMGTTELVKLCRMMPDLRAFVHASTAYANCHLPHIDERVYALRGGIDAQKLVDTVQWISAEMADRLAPLLLNGHPNTYTLTKAVAESQLQTEAARKPFPIVILRPSIIGAVWREPLPGWSDNMNGPNGIFAAVGKGLVSDMMGSGGSKADIVPVDCVSSMMIAAAAHRATFAPDVFIHHESGGGGGKHGSGGGGGGSSSITADGDALVSPFSSNVLPVLHCTTGALNPVKWERIVIYIEQFFRRFPFDDCYGVPSTQFHRRRALFLMAFYSKNFGPAYVVDRLLSPWKRPWLVRTYRKIMRMMETLHHFTTREWRFAHKNMLTLWDSLSDNDKKRFVFDVRQLDWDRYLFDYLMGLKLYLLCEHLENLPSAQANLLWLHQIYFGINAASWALIVRLFAWRKTKGQRWSIWLAGFLGTYAWQNFGRYLRPRVYLRTLDEYQRYALPAYAPK